MDYKLLQNRMVYGVLIGDMPVYEGYTIPRYLGSRLCGLSTAFGLPKTYAWKEQNLSRWEYMRDLLKMAKERYNSNGDLMKKYADVKALINMTQKKEWDVRVYGLLNGLNKIIDFIGRMRNMKSDAQGAGM